MGWRWLWLLGLFWRLWARLRPLVPRRQRGRHRCRVQRGLARGCGLLAPCPWPRWLFLGCRWWRM